MSSDEFDDYDFSEFTADDLAAVDQDVARQHGGPAIQLTTQESPFDRFRSWKNHLAVTDLVSPLWCEIQFEYSLYGRRHKPLRLRPSTFTSRNGKKIRVRQQVALAKDRTLERGTSVHKALEDELHPVKLAVRVVSSEERFGLRLMQLIDGFNELVTNGITRELPVFVISHGQVVVGVIDEVLQLPLSQGTQDQVCSARSTPSTPSASPPKKKQRQLSLSTQQQITCPDPGLLEPSVANAIPGAESTQDVTRPPLTFTPGNLYELQILDYKTRRSSSIPLDEDSLSPRIQLMMYHRMLSSLLEPETFDFDVLWNQLNLDPTKPFSAQFLKDINWGQRQVDVMDCNAHLNCLVSEWISTVQRQRHGLSGVSQQLQIVYRQSVFAGKRREKRKDQVTTTVDRNDPLEALALQEELDLACAIEESLREMGYQKAGQVAGHVVHDIKQAGSSTTSTVQKDHLFPLGSGKTDPAVACAIQQSLLTCAHMASDQTPADNIHETDTKHDDEPLSDEIQSVETNSDEQVLEQNSIDTTSHIIGMKKFNMDDDELDRHLTDVLQWWHGARPARGVNVAQAHRCFTCEYQDSCEWREQKASEAATPAAERIWGKS